MINISGLDNSVFAPQAPITGDNTNFAKNLSAIINPTQTLEQKQNEQIAKSVAGLQYSSVIPDLQNKYYAAKQDFMNWQMDAYKKNKGKSVWTGKPTLSPADEIEKSRRQNELMTYAAWGKRFESSLESVYKDQLAMTSNPPKPGERVVSKEDIADFNKGVLDEIKNSKKGVGEVQDPHLKWLNFVAEKGQVVPAKPEDVAKEQRQGEEDETRYDKRVTDVDSYKNRTTPVTPALAERDLREEYPENGKTWQAYRKLKENRGIIDPKDDYETAVGKIAKELAPHVKFSREQPGIATGTTSLPQTFKLATDESGRRAVDLSTSNVPIKGNYGGREVDGVIDAVGVNKKGEKVAWVQQDKMVKGKGASRGKMVSSGEKETVEVPYTPILAKELHDKHKINIDWTDAGKSEEQKSEAEKRGL